ncbi:MAG: response regulator transcription factor [Chloroflexota bacterium]|jgi:DNA-binding winged helix-turn-helix (wHTH) protein|nr:response regulator transcription factor [Chloroflexota bacterium]MEC9099265.1 response regulator transcription factor [Chloroflexota bacterium]MED5236967.1 response regulator transcription factor [Chloroflexota bacterium]|tara:strand:+ start:20145 stop:20918 length:774 start_codon:yes stop_codon:yes gene_type:complete
MFQNISLIGFNLRSEDYLIKLLKDNFEQINIICVEEFNIKEIDGVISLKAKANNHPLIENSLNSSEYFVDIENEQKTLCLINLAPSFSENISNLVQLDIPKIYNFEEYEVAKTYFFEKKHFSTQIITMPVAPNDLITKINLSNYQIATLTDSVKTEKVINQGNLKIDTEKYLVTLEGKKIDLTFKELELLKVLSSNPGRVFSRENLLKSIWDYDYYGGTRTVDVHVRRLRRKIEDHKYNFIETIWNVGYKFNEIELG